MYLKFLNLRQTCKIIGLAGPTIKRMAREGKFPQPIPLAGKRYGWDAEAVLKWVKHAKGAEVVEDKA